MSEFDIDKCYLHRCATPPQFNGKRLSEVTPDGGPCKRRMRADHHFLYVSMTIMTVTVIIICFVMCVVWYYGRAARKYRSLQNRGGDSVQYSGGSVSYPRRSASVPYRDMEEDTRDDDDTLFSINDK